MLKKLVMLSLVILILAGCRPTTTPPPTVQRVTVTSHLITPERQEPAITETPTPKPTASATPEPTPTPIPKRYTVVLLGEDRSGTGSGPRTDVFVILTYTERWPDLVVMNVPRDLYVEYGGEAAIFCDPPEPWDRINRAFALGGFDCVRAVVEHNFGLVVNSGVAAVDFDGFVELVDGMDGLTIRPSRSYSDWCANRHDEGGFWATWSAGRSYLVSGEILLCYVRARMQSGDLDRTRRAQEVLLAMKEQWFDEITLGGFQVMLGFFLDRVRVDLSLDEIVGLFEIAKASALKDEQIRGVTFSDDQEIVPHITEGGAWVYRPIVDLRGWTACLLDGFNAENCAWLNPLEETE